MPSLPRLDLAGTDVGDKGLPHLGQLTGLTSLLLNYTRITDGGGRASGEARQACKSSA